jgi:hypothetical protein
MRNQESTDSTDFALFRRRWSLFPTRAAARKRTKTSPKAYLRAIRTDETISPVAILNTNSSDCRVVTYSFIPVASMWWEASHAGKPKP